MNDDEHGGERMIAYRRAIGEALQGWVSDPECPDRDDDAEEGVNTTEGAIVTAFVAICELVQPDGTRRLARMDGVSTDGRAGVPWWLSNGMLLAYLELD